MTPVTAATSTGGTMLPACAGIGLRPPHHARVLAERPDLGWVEVHSENFFCAGGEALEFLEEVRRRHPVSLHGVGLSLGSPAGAPSRRHLAKLRQLADRIRPAAVSEHLSWSMVGERHLNDLLPLPHTDEALATVCERVRETQDVLGHRLLVENVSSYVRFKDSPMAEWDFVAEVAQRTGCGILLDVNNIYVSARNHGFDPMAFVAAIPPGDVAEIHLAGHEETDGFLVDTHGRPVCDAVWDLYRRTLARTGPRPTLVEWDTDIPDLRVLLAEAAKADRMLEAPHALAA